jgi:hypothetical protein
MAYRSGGVLFPNGPSDLPEAMTSGEMEILPPVGGSSDAEVAVMVGELPAPV